jgi:hypothetical protein
MVNKKIPPSPKNAVSLTHKMSDRKYGAKFSYDLGAKQLVASWKESTKPQAIAILYCCLVYRELHLTLR